MADIFKQLAAPFPPAKVHWRVGSTNKDKTKGMALAYIDARDVYDRLDEVCGPGGWQCRYPHANGKTCCEIGVKVGDEWVWKANGAGDTDQSAEKGAFSDALKRAAVVWGVGRYLYDLGNIWVQIVPQGRSYVIADHEKARLQKVLPGSNVETAHAPEPKTETPTGQRTPSPSEFAYTVEQTIKAQKTVEAINKYLATVAGPLKHLEHDEPALYEALKKTAQQQRESLTKKEAA